MLHIGSSHAPLGIVQRIGDVYNQELNQGYGVTSRLRRVHFLVQTDLHEE